MHHAEFSNKKEVRKSLGCFWGLLAIGMPSPGHSGLSNEKENLELTNGLERPQAFGHRGGAPREDSEAANLLCGMQSWGLGRLPARGEGGALSPELGERRGRGEQSLQLPCR